MFGCSRFVSINSQAIGVSGTLCENAWDGSPWFFFAGVIYENPRSHIPAFQGDEGADHV